MTFSVTASIHSPKLGFSIIAFDVHSPVFLSSLTPVDVNYPGGYPHNGDHRLSNSLPS